MRQIRYLLLLFLPALVYLAWLLLLHYRARRTGSTDLPALREGPWFWLILAGILLTIAAYIGGSLLEPTIPAGTYQPPRLEDGRVVPAQRAPGG